MTGNIRLAGWVIPRFNVMLKPYKQNPQDRELAPWRRNNRSTKAVAWAYLLFKRPTALVNARLTFLAETLFILEAVEGE